jgi:ATP-binding cassette subfamily F protein 3
VAHGHNVRLGWFGQNQAESLDPARTVLEEIRADSPVGTTELELRSLLGRFLFQQDDAFKLVAVLSGGERSRLALAKLLLRPANLLLLDEPTNHLDIGGREVLERALIELHGTAIVASHDRYLLDRVATRIVEVGGGRLTSYAGNYSQYRERRAQLAARAAAKPIAVEPPPSESTVEPPRGRVRPEREARAAAGRMSRIEDEVGRLESRRTKLEARLAEPELWTDAAAATAVVDELGLVQAAIERATARWEELAATT